MLMHTKRRTHAHAHEEAETGVALIDKRLCSSDVVNGCDHAALDDELLVDDLEHAHVKYACI
jgi:hypothetical protein